ERVRQRGRMFKRFIDDGIDVGSVKDKLLDPAFDLNGWSRSKTMMKKPERSATGALSAVSPAQIRKTQALKVVAPASVKPTTLAHPVAATDLGFLEVRGRRFPLGAELVSIGRDPKSNIALDDAGVSVLHAQITNYQGVLYLSDMGS